MTLERQAISVPVGVGQTDREAAPYLEGNAESRNVQFPKRGQADKRTPRTTLGSVPTLGTFGNGQIVEARGLVGAFSSSSSNYYDPEIDTWSYRNRTDPRMSDVRVSALLRGRPATVNPSMAIVGGTMCVCWSELVAYGLASVANRSDIEDHYVAFYDISGDTPVLLAGPTLSGFYRSAHVVALETGTSAACFIMIGETSDDQMGWARYTLTAADYTFGSITALPLRWGVNVGYDACGHRRAFAAVGGTPRAYAVYGSAAGTTVVSIGATGAATTATIATAGRTRAIACMTDATVDRLWIGQLDGAVYSVPYTSIGTAETGYGTIVPPTGMTVQRVTFMGASSNPDVTFCMSSRTRPIPGGGLTTPRVWGTWCHRMADPTLTAGFLLRNLEIAGKCVTGSFSNYTMNNGGYLPVLGGASRRLFFVSMDEFPSGGGPDEPLRSAVVAAMSEDAWCESNYIGTLSETSWTIPYGTDADGRIHWVYPRATSLRPGSDPYPLSVVDGIGLDHVRCEPLFMPPRRTAETQDVTFIAAGSGVACADSMMSVETTPQRPDPPFLTDIVVADATFPAIGGADTYYWSVGWGWYDASGREHRGPISFSNKLISGASIDSMVVAPADVTPYMWAVPYPAHGAHLDATQRAMFLDVYLSAPTDPEYRRRVARLLRPMDHPDVPDCKVFYPNFGASVPSPTYPDADVPFDTDVRTDPLLPEPYTDSELESVAPAATLSITSSQSRVWAISAESRFAVQVSKPLAVGYSVEFATELAIDIPAEGGECVGLASVDDKIVVFKRDRIFVVYGEPGDAAGENSTLQLPRLVSTDVGCICEASIVEGPFGVAFQSARGLVVLGRDLGLTNIGERVRDVTDGKLLAGTLVTSASEVRWIVGSRTVVSGTPDAVYPWIQDGIRLVWSYIVDQWSVWDDGAQSEIVVDPDVWTLDGGSVAIESDDWTTAAYGTKIVSPWIRVAGVEGFQRVWRVVALLYYYTGNVRFSVAYDYDDATVESRDFLESVCTAQRAANGRLELSIKPSRQKCAAIRVTVEEIFSSQSPPYPTVGQGLSVVSLDMEIGVKSGTIRRRLSNAQKG